MSYKIFLVMLLAILTSCESLVLEKEPEPVIITGVSFKDSILPIFNQSCNASGCHSSGGIPPDLSEFNAYNSLVYGNMVDTITPEQSLLYVRMNDNVKPMPTSGLLPVHDRNLVLGWISEGALNN